MDPKISCVLMDPPPHVIWWTLQVHQNTWVPKYWSLALNENSEIWGNPVHGKVWGAGAGPGPSGYSVERIDGSSDLVISGKGLSLNILTKLYFLLPIYLPTIGWHWKEYKLTFPVHTTHLPQSSESFSICLFIEEYNLGSNFLLLIFFW